MASKYFDEGRRKGNGWSSMWSTVAPRDKKTTQVSLAKLTAFAAAAVAIATVAVVRATATTKTSAAPFRCAAATATEVLIRAA